jgi:microcompartment protein CcmL/EutN
MDTLGLVESKNIAGGVELADGMVKMAKVELVRATTVCSGRYLIFVAGDREAVSTAVRFAEESGRPLMGSFVISNVSPLVLEALKKSSPAADGDAISVVECRTVAAGVAASDSAVKRAYVRILRMVTGQGIHGKSYFVLGGDVAAVRAATEAAEQALGGRLIESVVIPRPDESVVKSLTHRME